jgi:hypothetical protein
MVCVPLVGLLPEGTPQIQELQQRAQQQQQQQQWKLNEVAMDAEEWGRFLAAAAPLAAIVDAAPAAGHGSTGMPEDRADTQQGAAIQQHLRKRTGEQQQQPQPKRAAASPGERLLFVKDRL